MRLRSTTLDYAGKTGQVSVYVDPAITTGNATVVYEAIEAMQLGTMGDSYLVEETQNDTGAQTLPVSPNAQRTTKYQVHFTDDVSGKPGFFSIPCADLSLLAVNSFYVDLEGEEAAALVTALEAHGKSRDGNAITVSYIIEVGESGQ
jgi:hypothetical protein